MIHQADRRTAAGLVAGVLLAGAASNADVKVYPLFTDDMVLQRDKPIPVWGTAAPDEKISVSIGNQKQNAVTDAAGNWRVVLKRMPAAQELALTIKGDNEIVLKNVAVGDVYICSGQSNMEWSVENSNNAGVEIASANYKNLRLFTVPHKISGKPVSSFSQPVRWQVTSPQSVRSFSAVGYFFGRELYNKLAIPIGLINSSWGGTYAQAWTSQETLLKRDDLKDETQRTTKQLTEFTDEAFNTSVKDWSKALETGAEPLWQGESYNDAGWGTMKEPTAWENAGIPDFDGIVRFRKTVDIPQAWAGKDVVVALGMVDDLDTTYWNGEEIGSSPAVWMLRRYTIPGAKVKAGKNVLAVRVYDNGWSGGFTGGDAMRLELAGDATQKIDLTGDWKYQKGLDKSAYPGPPNDPRGNPNQPTVLYNGMIAPLLGFPVRGVIWYQGEANAGNPVQYQTLFPDLIRDWRTKWNAGQEGKEFGFYFVQLANWTPRVPEPVQAGWADLREAQIMALQLPRTGMATILDIGDTADIHPRNKQDVGKRLALNALAKEYGENVEYSGPTYYVTEVVDGKTEVKIHWKHAQGLKTTDGQAPRCFAILGADGKWRAATARIEGNTVVLAADVAPVGIRYAWTNNPDVNLVNSDGLPAVPFRTDAAK